LRNTHRTVLAATTISLCAAFATAAPAFAADGSVQGDLTPVPINGVDGGGEAMIEISGTTLTFTLAAQGLLDGAPHAAHIHYGDDSRNSCPTADDNTAEAVEGETGPENHLTTSETAPAYGPIVVSLTTSGDTSPDSGLAVDRFSADGDFEYMRGDVQVTEELAQDILSGESAVVVHGVDHDGDGTYSMGERGVSDLDPTLPGEATDPAICGVLAASQMDDMPAGGVDTGAGSTSGTENLGLIGGGAAAVLGGAFLVARNRRQTVQDRA
jgi:hypothetical protein